MLDRFGLSGRDRRNLVVVVAATALVIAALSGGPVVVRLAVGVVMGLVSGCVFVAVTVLLDSAGLSY
jgi:hypothetical protein